MLSSALTTHSGVPDVMCELPGAFAGLKLLLVGVYVPGATLANATEDNTAIMPAASSTVTAIRRTCLMFASFVTNSWSLLIQLGT
jgi:hypothetical protein